MNILETITSFILSFLFHFGYDISNNFLFSIMFPVNESIWEHMKIISTSILISSLIFYFFKKNKKNNYFISIIISIISSIIFYLILYLPIDHIFGHNLIISIILLFITFIFSEFIKNKIIESKKINNQFNKSIILLIIIYFIFGFLTYNPINSYIFKDKTCNCYGIK